MTRASLPSRAAPTLFAAAATVFLFLLLPACKDSVGTDNAQNDRQDRILFVSDRGGAVSATGSPLSDIYSMNPDGTDVTDLTATPAATYRELGLSPDHEKVVFESDRAGCYNVWVMEVGGTGPAQLTGAAGDGCNETPRWSPDGSKIAFHTSRESVDRSWEVYVMNANGTDPRNVSDNGGVAETAWDFSHGWTPDGKVVFHHVVSDYETFVVNTDGTGFRPLFASAASYAPFWSPDGSKVAFVSERDAHAEIYVMNADGTAEQNLTNASGADTFDRGDAHSFVRPWSPDGARLAFMSDRNGNRDVYVMNADGSGLVNLSNHPGDDRFDCWSPDGSRIVFSSDRSGTRDLYIVNADGTGLVRLTDGAGNDRGAIWVPGT